MTPNLINFLIIKITGGVGSDGGPNFLLGCPRGYLTYILYGEYSVSTLTCGDILLGEKERLDLSDVKNVHESFLKVLLEWPFSFVIAKPGRY